MLATCNEGSELNEFDVGVVPTTSAPTHIYVLVNSRHCARLGDNIPLRVDKELCADDASVAVIEVELDSGDPFVPALCGEGCNTSKGAVCSGGLPKHTKSQPMPLSTNLCFVSWARAVST